MNGGTSPQLQIVVLAAGFSSRLGRPKALARVRGISLLRRAVSAVAPLAQARVIVVAPPRCSRYRVELAGQSATLVANPRRSNGLSSSVRCAIVHARRTAAVLILPVDLVRLQRREVARLICAWKGSRRRVIARRIGAAAGTPLILPRWLFQRALSIEGERGLRDFVQRLPRKHLGLRPLASAQTDVDTQQDLDFARRCRRIVTRADHQRG